MTKAIITDLNRCVGCLACSVACKGVNNVPIGSYWNKVVRVGPNPIPGGSGQYPDVYMYFLPISCQHCENPECVKVCPTEASHVAEDGLESFEGSEDPLGNRRKMVDFLEPFTEADMHKLPDVGNKPSYSYILRGQHWEGGDE